MRFLVFIIIPLYTLLNITNMIFPTGNSPAGIKYRLGSTAGFYQHEGVRIAGFVLVHVLFLAISSGIVALGLHWDPWRVEQVEEMLRKFNSQDLSGSVSDAYGV